MRGKERPDDTILLPALIAAPLHADVVVTFQDSAPKDIFSIRHDGTCPLSGALNIDIGAAPSGLIFDTAASGAGVQVFQPFEVTEGASVLLSVPVISDGDSLISLAIQDLVPGDIIRFTIDVDDTTSRRQITVDGSEIAGAVASFEGGSGRFDAKGTARIPVPGCFS
ncbi:MAG: aggregation factor core [Pseudomonadota bacterium]